MNTPLVSVFCLAYNHEKYIKNALDGFVMQKTTFPFEVLIHNDASTDNTAIIIREYAEKYPEIIKPVLQTENQYSKGVRIIEKYLRPNAKGKYVAWCEGDDCWIDDGKLQKQVDFLESHPEYSCCYHKVLMNNLHTGKQTYIPQIEESRDFELEEIVRKGAVFQLSSAMLRSSFYMQRPECFFAKGFGDIQIYMYGAICGKCHVLGDVMSVYNHGTPGSWTNRVSRNKQKNLEHEKAMLKMLEKVNEYYDYKYNDDLTYAIKRAEFNILILTEDKKKAKSVEYREFYSRYRKQKKVQFIQKHFPLLLKIKHELTGK